MGKTFFKQNNFRLVLGAFLLFFAFLLVGCAKTAGEDIFRFEVRELSMTIGEEIDLKLVLGTIEDQEICVEVADSKGSPVSDVISLAKTTITAGEKVGVTAVSEGTVLLTAYVKNQENVSDTITVVVSKEKLTAMSAVPTKDEMLITETAQFTVTTYPLDKNIDKSVIYTSSNENVGTITESGLFTAVGVGETIVTVTSVYDPTVKVVKKMNVLYNDTTDVIVEEAAATIILDTTYQINTTVLPNEYPLIANPNVTYTSSDEKIATVSETGLVTAKGVGEATITLESVDGIQEVVNITVIYETSTGIDVAELVEVNYNGTAQISAKVVPANANPSFTYASSDESVVTVSETGKVTGVNVGTATITITTVDGVSVDVTVQVNTVYKITIGGTTVKEGGTIAKDINTEHEIVVTATPEKEVEISYEIIPAEGSSGDIISITDNKLSCLAVGTVTLKITVDGNVYTLTFRVKE